MAAVGTGTVEAAGIVGEVDTAGIVEEDSTAVGTGVVHYIAVAIVAN